LKKIAVIVLCFFICTIAKSQYYLRGEVKDAHDNFLSNVKIRLHSTGYLYYTGSEGTFGIEIRQPVDSITIYADQFQSVTVPVSSARYASVVLTPLFAPVAVPEVKLLSSTWNRKPEDWHGWTVGGETYNSLSENEFISAQKFPETGFAVNVDKASYSNVRRFINMESTVPPDAVRIEELLNYFNLDYNEPPADSTFSMHSFLSPCPWNADNQLLFVHLCAKKIDLEKTPPANLVFLIDVSGSMDLPNRLPLLKSAFRLLVNNLRKMDTVSIVVYGSTVGLWLPPTPGDETEVITKAIEELSPGGPTPGEAGIRAAYRIAGDQYIRGGNNRVILATDGDFNVGVSTEEELEKLIIRQKHLGIYLTCLGVGMGNYKDSKLQVLSARGNGNFAYLDDEKEAEKVLMQEFTQTMYAVADDAYVDIAFDSAMVKEYRLIGFDNKWKALQDSVQTIQGGEVGSGHSLIALFEIKPTRQLTSGIKTEMAKATLHYKKPNDSLPCFSVYSCMAPAVPFIDLPPSLRFAASVAMFGELLRKSEYVKEINWKDTIDLAHHSQNPKDALQKEFIQLVEKARKIYRRRQRQ
jgi:Ca-activated chloride channel homolog